MNGTARTASAARTAGVRLGSLALVALVAATAAPASAQTDKVRVEVSYVSDSTASDRWEPTVRSSNMLSDPRWLNMLRSGFPLRMHYRLEMWRSRSGWFDDFVRQVEWDVVVRHEPLLDQFAVTTLMPGGRTLENRYGGEAQLARALGFSYRIAIRPTSPGEYYYNASLQVATLSDSDLDELQRFLRGDLGPAASEGRDLGDALGRGATRILLKLGGLPSLRVEGRSRRFRVGG